MFPLAEICPGGLRGRREAHQDRVSGHHHRCQWRRINGFSRRYTGDHQPPSKRPGRRRRLLCIAALTLRDQPEELAYAETLFGDDLAGIDPTVWESTLLPVFNKFVDTYGFPTGLNATARLPGWADTMRNTVADTIESGYLQAKGAKYQAPAGIKDASPWKQITERGNLKNWKIPGVDAVKGGSRTIKAADALRTGGKLAGRACAVVDGVVSAYDSYQSDSYHHPEMGQGEKVARAGVTGALAAGGAYAGASAGAQLGAAIGAFGGPVGILAGGVIGGVVGGFIGSKLGQGLATGINNAAYSAIHGGGQPS